MARYPEVADSARGLRDQAFGNLAARATLRVGKLHALHIGDTHRMPPAVATTHLADLDARAFLYSPVQGEPELLDAIEQRLRTIGTPHKRASLQVCSGATSGLTLVANALLSPGDEVIVPSPYWPLIRGIVRARGAVPVEVPFFESDGSIAIDFVTRVENAITARTTAIYWNTPHNPTGIVFPEHTIREVAELAQRRQLWIVSDEVYDELSFTAAHAHITKFADARTRTVSVYSVSKLYGLAGARVGYVAGPECAMDAVRAVQTYITYCAPRLMQRVAASAISCGQTWVEESRSVYAHAGHRMAEQWQRPTPHSGTFVFAPIPQTFRKQHRELTGQTLADRFLEACLDSGVILTPGASCGAHYQEWVRACYTVVAASDLEEAVAALAPLFA